MTVVAQDMEAIRKALTLEPVGLGRMRTLYRLVVLDTVDAQELGLALQTAGTARSVVGNDLFSDLALPLPATGFDGGLLRYPALAVAEDAIRVAAVW